MKKFSITGLVILFLLSLAACGTPKTALSADEFRTKAEEAGYEVQDALDQFADAEAVEAVLIAIDKTNDFQIEFYVLQNENQAIQSFNNNKNGFESNKGNESSESSVSLSNYSKYALSTNGQYYVVSRIDRTFIYVVTSDVNKETVNSMLRSLGY